MAKKEAKPEVLSESELISRETLRRRINSVLEQEPNLERAAFILRMRPEELQEYIK